MYKCCRNCHFYNRSTECCESGELTPRENVEDRLDILLEDGVIHGLCEELGLADDDSESGDRIATFFKTHLNGDVGVHIKNDRDFYCNMWR